MHDATTSDRGQELARIGKKYLYADMKLEKEEKAALITANNTKDRLRGLFGKVGHKYRKLSGLQA